MGPYETVLIDRPQPHLLLVTMNRPAVGNARNTQMGREMLTLWTHLAAEPGDVRCVVLSGAGKDLVSSFPLTVSGSAAMATTADGTMYDGSRSPSTVRALATSTSPVT